MRRTALPRLARISASCIATLTFFIAPLVAQQRQSLPNRLAAPREAQSLNRLPDSQVIGLSISLPLRNQTELRTLLQQLHDPKSPQFGKFLTPQQFTDRFGPTAADYAKVLDYARAHGLKVTRTYPTRTLINASGPVAAVNQLFHVTMKSYQHPSESRRFFAPDVEPTIEPGLPILSVHGLSNYNRPRPMLKHAPQAALAHANTTGSGEGGQFLGSDMRAAYAPSVALDGAGQSVGLIELGPYNKTDVTAYFQNIGQSLSVPIYDVLLNVDGVCAGTPSNGGCDDGEEVIDIQQAISMAPHLSALIVYEAYGANSDALTAFTQAANDNVAKQLSLSFGWGGTPATEPGYEQIFMQLAAQGQNVFVASGDSGASVGDVGYPGNSPNIVDVGGTDLTTAGAGGPWQSESGWVGSGGGWSDQSPIPGYQVPVITAQNQGSPSFRNIPDVAMEANTDNYFCANGSCSGGIGGTSLAAPRWAGYLALVNQQANGLPVGFLNPTVYTIGQGSTYTTLFHDITTGDNFNTGSPALFSATTGYDLVTGWGSPNGQSMINALAPANGSAPNFALTAAPSTISLTPGSSGTTTINVAATNGFTGTVQLNVALIGAPPGVSGSLNTTSITGSGSSTLTVSTTAATPGGTIILAVTGNSGSITQTVYINLALPDFGVTATPSALYLNQSNYTTGKLAVTQENGFAGSVKLALSGRLPEGVIGSPIPTRTASTSTLALAAGAKAITQPGGALTLTGTSGAITHTVSSLTLAVSAATGTCGTGTPVSLASAYNLAAFFTDGKSFTTGGLDGGGAGYSANQLTSSRVLDDIVFRFGPANANNAVYGTGQTIALPAGRYNTLQLLGTGIDGRQASQPITVTYTDGTSTTFAQSFSDWFSPGPNVNETEAVAMPYRDTSSGSKDNRSFHLYGYTLLLNPAKTAKSFTLPSNRAVIILAATLANEGLGSQVNLASAFNATGIYSDGATFAGDGGIDAGGAAFSANLLGDVTSPVNVTVHDLKYRLPIANQPNTVFGAGQQIALPAGRFTELHLLGTGVQGNQEAQTLTITYTDGSTQKVTQSFSDWFTPQGYANESQAVRMPYRNFNDGSTDNSNFNLYDYTIALNPSKTVKAITLPDNRNVVFVAMTLSSQPELLKWINLCGFSATTPMR